MVANSGIKNLFPTEGLIFSVETNSPEYVLFLQYNLTKAKRMQPSFENGNVVQHTSKMYTMY